MKKQLLLLTTFSLALAACAKSSTPDVSGANAAASSVLTVTPISSSVAPSGTTSVSVTGGTNVYVSAVASQGTILQTATSTFFFTAPATPTSSLVTVTVTDSGGAVGSAVIMVTGSTTTNPGGTTGTAFTTTSCGGSFSITAGTSTGTLTLTQNTNNAVAGYIYLPSNNYYLPVVGTCQVTVGSTSGSMNLTAYTNTPVNQTYVGTIRMSGGQMIVSGTVTTSSGSLTFTANSTALAAAPVAETLACDGTYGVNVGGNTGTLRLVHNGSGQVSGLLNLQTYYYAITGTCGSTMALRNLFTSSNYTGTATFNGQSVSMTGTFGANGQTYNWTANK